MDKAFDVKMIADFIPTLAGYLPITLYILALSLIFGFILGVLLSLPRIYKIPVLDQLARVYISFFRGTPIMVQLFIVFYGIPALSSIVGIDLSQMDPPLCCDCDLCVKQCSDHCRSDSRRREQRGCRTSRGGL